MPFTEANFENAIIEILRDHLGYDYIYGPDVVREYTEPLHIEQLRTALSNSSFGSKLKEGKKK